MKRILVGLAVGATVFAVVVGMAASLGGINTDGLGADDSVVASCDSNGVNVNYSVAYNVAGTAGYKVGDVSVSGIADACDGATIKVTLTGAGNSVLAEQTSTVAVDSGATPPDSDDALNFLGTNTLAENVTGVHVVITG